MKESLGLDKEDNGMSQALPPTFRTFPLPAQLQMASQLKINPKRPACLKLPVSLPQPTPLPKYAASLTLRVLSVVIRPVVAPPCLNKGNLSSLRSSSFLLCLLPSYSFHVLVLKPRKGRGTRVFSYFSPLFPLSLSDDLRNRELLPFDCSASNISLPPAPTLR